VARAIIEENAFLVIWDLSSPFGRPACCTVRSIPVWH